ncbi:MAG: fibronectin type III domain-containing protein [bacterium]
MATAIVQRNYNITDAELCMFTSNLCITMTRDLLDLADFGITAPKIAALKALGDAFEILPSDEVLMAYVIAATETKSAKAELVKEAIRNMVTRCQIKWGVDSWQEKSLGVKGMNKYTDDSLLVAGRRVHTQMTAFLPDLAGTGLTQDMLDDMDDLNDELETAKNSQFTKVSERENETEDRINKGNEIYSLVSMYCEIGKRVYAKSDPAKYNDYIIYTSPSSGNLTAPANLAFDPIMMNFTWDAVENATSYEFESSSDGTTFSHVWAGPNCDYGLNEVPTTVMHYRVKARNANGYGPYSAVIHYDFLSPLIAPFNLAYDLVRTEFTWNQVPAATSYQIQYKHLDQVEWTSLEAGNGNSYMMLFPWGDYLAKIRALRYWQEGPFSTELAFTIPQP